MAGGSYNPPDRGGIHEAVKKKKADFQLSFSFRDECR
jgi:hypothetical protein